MTVRTLHRVDGVGRWVQTDDSQPFNPSDFEQAIRDLQRIVLDAVRFDDDPYREEDYDPRHEQVVEDGRKVLKVDNDTLLGEACKLIPRKWNVSVLVDQVVDDAYALGACVDCGGGIRVHATLFFQGGIFSKFNVGHSVITDPEDEFAVTDLSVHASSKEITHLNRMLERSVMQAYASEIPSAATAFDYIGTRGYIPRGSGHTLSAQERRGQSSQAEWADVRGKTQQTVSDNVRTAKNALLDLPDSPAFGARGPAFEELDPDADDKGDVRLV